MNHIFCLPNCVRTFPAAINTSTADAHFCLFCNRRTAAVRCTSVRRTFRCMATTIAKTQQSSRKDFSDSGRRKTARRRRACSRTRKRRTFTVVEPAAASLSKINQTWVCAGLHVFCSVSTPSSPDDSWLQ